jgi:hypothetical protein
MTELYYILQVVDANRNITCSKSWASLKTQWVGSLAYAELRYEGRGCEK